MNKNMFKSCLNLSAVCLVAACGFAAKADYTDERVSIGNLPTGFVPAPKDLGDGNWVYVFDKPADNMVVTLRKDLVISRALVVGGGGGGSFSMTAGRSRRPALL